MRKLMMAVALALAMCTRAMAEVPVYVWQGWDSHYTEQTLTEQMRQWKDRGVDGVCLNTGFDLEKARVGAAAAHSLGLEFHAWAPTMVQAGLDPSWYTVNRNGEPADKKPAYVPYYTTLDPANPEVVEWLKKKVGDLASVPGVDYVQLDYIRYADVILARGLWAKYGLVMKEEYAPADYCYCNRCVETFKKKTGIDIRKVKDPSKCKEWAQFRCDAVTSLVNQLAEVVHAKGKKISADVFPGPYSHAVPMVRQEWNKWKVDALFPMNYNDFYLKKASWLKKIVKEETRSIAGSKNEKLYSGLFICHDWPNKHLVVDPENSGLLPSEMRDAVLGSLRSGAYGICLFTASSMTDEHWKALDEALKDWAAGKRR